MDGLAAIVHVSVRLQKEKLAPFDLHHCQVGMTGTLKNEPLLFGYSVQHLKAYIMPCSCVFRTGVSKAEDEVFQCEGSAFFFAGFFFSRSFFFGSLSFFTFFTFFAFLVLFSGERFLEGTECSYGNHHGIGIP